MWSPPGCHEDTPTLSHTTIVLSFPTSSNLCFSGPNEGLSIHRCTSACSCLISEFDVTVSSVAAAPFERYLLQRGTCEDQHPRLKWVKWQVSTVSSYFGRRRSRPTSCLSNLCLEVITSLNSQTASWKIPTCWCRFSACNVCFHQGMSPDLTTRVIFGQR